MKTIKYLSLILGLLILFSQPSWSAPLAGHVILTKGNVTATAEDGSNRALKRRSEIFNGDIIKTGAAGSVQIRFIDKALMTIKANSEMDIESYQLAQQGDGQKEQALMKLVKGGFRTITGTIGKGDKSAYKVNTPAASIGIRGTNYEVQQEADGGFVMGVYSGGIQVENEAGTINLGEGADFNFTRVKPKSAPKGLLAPPPSLGENSATEQSEEESEGEETTNEDGSDESDEGNDEGEVVEGESGEDDAPAAIAENTATDIDSNVTNAIDSKLTDTIEETKNEFVESDGIEDAILEALIAAGILQVGDTLDALDPIYYELVEKWLANSNFDLIAAIQDLVDQGVTSDFDFNNPYQGIDIDASGNPFASTIITDQEYALGESGKLALMAIPINSSSNYAGDSPSISTLEAQLTSAESVSFSYFDYSAESTVLDIHYKIIDPDTNQIDEYDISFTIDDDLLMSADDLAAFLAGQYEGLTSYRLNDVEQSGTPPLHIDIDYDLNSDGKFTFIPNTSSPNEFIFEMELSFNDTESTATQALLAQLGSDSLTDDDFWYADSGLDMFLGNGSWDANGRPILVNKDVDTYEDESNNQVTETTIEVIKKVEADQTVASLSAFGSCVDAEITCDIQVDNVSAANNIRWGAWLTEVNKGIQINEYDVEGNSFSQDNEEEILAFWIAAERADINQLVGEATFSATSDCAKYGQCIGFADDGVVQNLTAQFDVDFTRGTISNGNLNIETTQDPDLGLLGGSGAVESTWDVNFSGSMISDGEKKPEFQTQSINGTVTDSSGTHGGIIGNIGGIFVKPGDTFAGGYNLGTTDGSNKHAAGVFSMEKQ